MRYLGEYIPQAEFLVANDILQRPYWKDKGIDELKGIVYKIWCSGSAAVGDTGVELKHGEITIGTLYNTSLTYPADKEGEAFPLGYRRAGGKELTLFPTDVATTNEVYIGMLVD